MHSYYYCEFYSTKYIKLIIKYNSFTLSIYHLTFNRHTYCLFNCYIFFFFYDCYNELFNTHDLNVRYPLLNWNLFILYTIIIYLFKPFHRLQSLTSHIYRPLTRVILCAFTAANVKIFIDNLGILELFTRVSMHFEKKTLVVDNRLNCL